MVRILLSLLILFSTGVYAAELHVGAGQTYTHIQGAIDASGNGDTIWIHPGTYTGENNTMLQVNSGIDNTHRTIISGVIGEALPVIDCQQSGDADICAFDVRTRSYITFQYLHVTNSGGHERGAFYIGHDGNPNYITIDHCTVTNTNVGGSHASYNPAAIRLRGNGGNIVVSNCDLSGEDASGLKIETTGLTNVTIENNYIHDVLHGVAVKWGNTDNQTTIIRNNIIRNPSFRGMVCDQSYTLIENNIIDSPGTEGITFGSNYGGTYCTFSHNTMYGADPAIYFKGGAPSGYNTVIDNILYNTSNITDYGSGGHTLSNFTTDPDFTDAVNHDFSLEVGSGAIGTASDSKDYGADLDLVGIDGDDGPASTPSTSGLTKSGLEFY